MHDQIAVLRGYREELAGAEAYGRDEHAARVRPEIDRIADEITARVEALRAQADRAAEAADHGVAGKLREEAARLVSGLGADVAAHTPPAAENAAPSAPQERAVTKRGGK